MTLPPYYVDCLEILGVSTSRSPNGLSRSVMGYLYLYLTEFLTQVRIHPSTQIYLTGLRRGKGLDLCRVQNSVGKSAILTSASHCFPQSLRANIVRDVKLPSRPLFLQFFVIQRSYITCHTEPRRKTKRFKESLFFKNNTARNLAANRCE